jgi:hypothetical protein
MPSLISQLPGCRPSVGGAGILRRSTDACSDDEKDIHLLMKEILLASLLGLATTSSAMIEVAVGLYVLYPNDCSAAFSPLLRAD